MTPYDRQRHRARLQALADRLQHQAALIRNSSGDSKAEARAGKLSDDAYAIRALLKENDALRPKLPPDLVTLRGLGDLVRGEGA
jgi:hypothetical protein